MIQLTPEQADFLHREQEPRFIDPATNQVYVVISDELYRRLQEFVDDARERTSWQDLARRGRTAFLKDTPPVP